MSQLLQVSPLLDGMVQEAEIAAKDGSHIYRLCHEATGVRCIVKHLSIPASPIDTKALILTGAVQSNEEAHAYYESEVNRLRQELTAYRGLTASPNVCSYARFQVVAKENTPGFDVYLLAPERKSLKVCLSGGTFSGKMAVQLGMDLCRGLSAIREGGYIHQNLKPENIFLNGDSFAIGDFGLTALENLPHTAIPAKYIGKFTAPEGCSTEGKLNKTSDLYSVGMILYYVYNGNHAAFEDNETTEKAANTRRMQGEELPAPLYADYEMDAILHKACAPKPEDRYQTPEEFLSALEDYLSRNDVSNDSIVPPLVVDDEPLLPEETEAEENEPVVFATKETLSEDFRKSFQPVQETKEETKKKRHLWIPITLIVLLLLSAAFCYYYFEYNAITVDSLVVTDKGTDYLTITVNAEEMDSLLISCTADNGTGITYDCAETVTFTDLQPGTMHTISIETMEFRHLKGLLGGTAVTASMTEVLAFDTAEQEDGTYAATFHVSGPEPDVWTLTCEAEGREPLVFSVENHTCQLTGLLPNLNYTLTLNSGDGYHLTGNTSIPFSYTQPISGSGLTLEAVNTDSISVTWEADSDAEVIWNAVCSGDNGYAATLEVSECRAVFEGTSVNAEYTIAVSNEFMTVPMLLTVSCEACSVTDITAEANGTTVTVSWDVEGLIIPETWTLTYGPETLLNQSEITVDGSSITLEGLIPDAAYVFTLSDPAGNRIGGTMETTAKTGSTVAYDGPLGGFYPALFDEPNIDGWNTSNLATGKVTFAPGSPIVFGLEPNTRPAAQDEPEDVDVMLVIRNEDGDPISFSLETMSWNDMWDEKLFAALIETVPEEEGNYTLELYFDNKSVSSQKFIIAQ